MNEARSYETCYMLQIAFPESPMRIYFMISVYAKYIKEEYLPHMVVLFLHMVQ